MTAIDAVEMAVRTYAVRAVRTAKPRGRTAWKAVPPAPASNWTLIFDTEFRVDASQQLTVGTYQIREGGELRDAGFFFDPGTLSDSERGTLYAHAQATGATVLDQADFIETVLYRFVLDLDGTCVGFNLPLDLSRLAAHHDVAHTRSMRGGFTFQLSNDPRRPWLQIRHLSSRESFFRFVATGRQRTSRGMRRRGLAVPAARGHFVDVATLASALLEHKGSLRSLATLLGVDAKGTVDTYDGPISTAFLAYSALDTEVTWQCYAEIARRYWALGLETPIDRIFSAASIGKAHLDAMGIRPWHELQPDIPPGLTGAIMSGYFGGRSEVKLRRVITEVRYCDFLSMYPTVCTLMGLWRFVTTSDMRWVDTTAVTRAFLASITLNELQDQATWRGLATVVELAADDDLLPVRGRYDGSSYTIGLNFLTTDVATVWYTLADVVNAVLNGEKIPTIRRAITFSPGDPQPGLRAIDLMGNPAYRVGPAHDDVFRRMIELRSAVKARKRAAMAAGDMALADQLDAEQHALKIIANATSYGIFIELNVIDEADPIHLTCYGRDGAFVPTDAITAYEAPGRHFHPLLATLITAAARLMLGIAECLTRDAGLDWAFCDTDSLAVARPAGVPRVEFEAKVAAIQRWFDDLNPYDVNDPIFKTEDANFALGPDGTLTREGAPIFCFAVSAKRYVLFNLDPTGRPVIRKASAHGLGHLQAPYGVDGAPLDIPAPTMRLGDIGVARWQHDFWYRIVEAALAGRPAQVDLDLPGFDEPAMSRYAAMTPELVRWFRSYNDGRPYEEQVRPFGFLVAFHARGAITVSDGATDPRVLARRRRAVAVTEAPAVVAPFDRDPAEAARRAFDRRTGLPVLVSRLATYRQVLAQYHLHPEAKFRQAAYLDAGPTERRHVRPLGPIHQIGKEANRWDEQLALGANPEAQVVYGAPLEDLATYRAGVAARAAGFSVRAIAERAGVSIGTVSAVQRGLGNPSPATLVAIDRAVAELGPALTWPSRE